MRESERTPLLSSENGARPPTESSPLLSGSQRRDSHASDVSSKSHSGRRFRWPSIIAIVTLAALVVTVMVLGFLVPPAVEQYAQEALVLEPTGLSLESLTPGGVRARIQANFRLDGSRVTDNTARRLGRLATSIISNLDTEKTEVRVHLPHYDNALLGTAVVPPLTVNLVDGHNTEMDFVAELSPGDAESVRRIVNDWLDGNLEQLKLTGSAAITVRSGILPLGTHEVVESMVFEAKEIPSMPDYKIERLNIRDVPAGDGGRMAVGADASIQVYNDYPVGLAVPALGFDILVPNCDPSESYIMVATAVTKPINVQPHANVTVDAVGLIRDIPESLTRACPVSKMSPLDSFIQHYLHGEDAQIFVRGQKSDNSDVPDWVGSLLSSITVPLEFPGRSLDDAIRNLSVTDVDFKLPSPFADPSDPDGKPRVSGTIQVMAALPEELKDVDIRVDGLRASSDVIYEGEKFGELHVRKWQKADSTKIVGSEDEETMLKITSKVVDVPLDITDSDVFSDVMQELLFGDDDIILDVSSLVDVRVSTVLGNLTLKGVPAEGKIPKYDHDFPHKPLKGKALLTMRTELPGKSFTELEPRVGDVLVLNTSETAVHMRASVNLTNPTPYTAFIPYANVHVFQKGHLIGEVTAKDIDFQLGNNTNLVVYATWDPISLGGEESHRVSRRLLSDYLSGKNTTLTVKTHRGSIPAMPAIGEALSKINIILPTPRVKLPGDRSSDDQGRAFVRDATFHFFSSSASFSLASPLGHNTIHVERINATAFYNHTEPVGHIVTNEPFDAPPGVSRTPRLPVTWSRNSVGFDKLRDALGGTLKLDAKAKATLRIGNWIESVHYEGTGIGAKIRI